MSKKVEIKFKCACMSAEGSFYIDERRSDEDVAVFVERVRAGLTQAHHETNFLCASGKTEYVKIPVSSDGPDGVVGREKQR